MRMLNFWRSTFDSWLNQVAVEEGADFQDETSLIEFEKDDKSLKLTISKNNQQTKIRTRFLIGADGMLSGTRRKFQPESFQNKRLGTAINYYFEGKGNLDRNKLYMYYNREFCPLMFAWVYLKDEKWVIGTGANENAVDYIERFFNFVKEKYSLTGKIIKKEGFASTQKITTYLGEDNILLTGDAAGLIDLYRGVGMDLAALSGRFAVKAIEKAEKTVNLQFNITSDLWKKPSINLNPTKRSKQRDMHQMKA